MKTITDLLGTYAAGETAGLYCRDHPGEPSCGACRRCGRLLCSRCFLPHGTTGTCSACMKRTRLSPREAMTFLGHPAAILALAVAVLSVLYVSAGPGRIGPAGTGSRIRKDLSLHNWLYLGKGERLKTYADYLDAGRRPEAARYYRRARSAVREAVSGTEELYDISLSQLPGKRIEEEPLRQRFAGLLIGLAACYRGEGNTGQAIEALEKSMEADPPAGLRTLASYRLGKIYEEDLRDFAGAVAMYRQAQGAPLALAGLLDDLLISAGQPLHERKMASAVRKLAGAFDPAEAQLRIIRCYEKLGDREQAARETTIMLQKYPFSGWASGLGEPAAPGTGPAAPETVPQEREKDPEETLTIVPLEE